MHPILPVEVQVLALGFLLAFTAWVIWLIRNQRLHLRESLAWLLTTLAAIVVIAYPEFMVAGARLLGVQVPANALFGLALLYLAANVLAVTITVSTSTARVRRLTQECALLRAEIEALRASLGARAAAPGAQPPPAATGETRDRAAAR